MQRMGRAQEVDRWAFVWRGFVTFLASLCLVATLASRTFGSASESYSATTSSIVHTSSSQVGIQHRDADAYRWSVSTATFVLPGSSHLLARITPREEPLPALPLDNHCSNRPPPTS